MADRLDPRNLNNPQEMTVVVSGPEDANRLIICTGEAGIYSSVSDNRDTRTYTFLVGPALERRQFVRAIVSAGLTRPDFRIQPGATTTDNISATWNVLSADADWDDESGQVEVRVEIQVVAGPSTQVGLRGISYNVSILAALPAA